MNCVGWAILRVGRTSESQSRSSMVSCHLVNVLGATPCCATKTDLRTTSGHAVWKSASIWRRVDLHGVELAMRELSDLRKLASPTSKKSVKNVKYLVQHGLRDSSPVISVEKYASLELDLYHTSVPTDDEIHRPRWLSP